MPTERWRELTSAEDWNDVQQADGVIVISDVTRPKVYHRLDCGHVKVEAFTEKVIENGGRNGRYWWAPTAADAEPEARPCNHEAPDVFAPRGSRRQVQMYVNEQADTLDVAIADALPDLVGRDVDWRSPLAADGFAEYHDASFLKAVDHPELIPSLKAFWPRGGPRWDGLAVVDGMGVLLVEGKSYPGELEGGGCKATPTSQTMIRDALRWTRERLGVTSNPPEDWCGPLYQSANRLAHLAWLRAEGVEAWRVHLLVTDDAIKPTSAATWHDTMADADARLGLAGIRVPGAAHVVLPAL